LGHPVSPAQEASLALSAYQGLWVFPVRTATSANRVSRASSVFGARPGPQALSAPRASRVTSAALERREPRAELETAVRQDPRVLRECRARPAPLEYGGLLDRWDRLEMLGL